MLTVLNIVLVQLYWLSFVLIGFSITEFLHKKNINIYGLSNILSFVKKQPLLSRFFFYFVAGVTPFAVPIAVAYIFELPLLIIILYYLLLILFALYNTALDFSKHKKKVYGDYKLIIKKRFFGLIITFSLALNYIIVLFTKSLSADVPVHIARVALISQGYFTLSDPFFGNNGVVDVRYSANLLLGLQAVAVRLLHEAPYYIWQYSNAFFMLVIFLGFFSLLWNCLSLHRKHWAYWILAVLPFFVSYDLFFASQPDRIVIAWIAVFIIGLKIWLEENNIWLIMIGALLISVTHSLNSAIAAGYIVAVSIVLLLLKQITKKKLGEISLVVFILLSPVFATLSYPNLTIKSADASQVGNISFQHFMLHNYGGLYISKLPDITTGNPLTDVNHSNFLIIKNSNSNNILIVYIVYISMSLAILYAAVYYCNFILLKRKLSKFYAKILYLFNTWIITIFYQTMYQAIIGYIQILKSQKKPFLICLVILILYYPLIAYNPLAISILKDHLPGWAISRFQEMNLFAWVAPLLAWCYFIDFPNRNNAPKLYSRIVTFFLIACFILPLTGLQMPKPYLAKYKSYQDTNRNQYSYMYKYLDYLAPQLKNQVVFSNDQEVLFLLGSTSIKNFHTTSVNVTHYSSMANINLRQQCHKELVKNLYQDDLMASGATVVLAKDYDKKFIELIDSKPYLNFVKKNQYFRVYKFIPGSKASINQQASVCKIPWRQ